MANSKPDKIFAMSPAFFKKYIAKGAYEQGLPETYSAFVERYPEITKVRAWWDPEKRKWDPDQGLEHELFGTAYVRKQKAARARQNKADDLARGTGAPARETGASADSINLTNLAIVAAGVGALWWFAGRR